MARDIPLPSPTGGKPPSKPPTGTPSTTNKPTPTNTGPTGAETRAVNRENAAKRAAGKRYLEGAQNLQYQINALKHALKYDFKKARDNNLRDISKVLGQQLKLLKEGHKLRAEEFLATGKDNEKATASVAERAFSNLARERADTMTAILQQGAGETDVMQAMLMSARNWSGNASEANRAFYDTQRSINAGINDLNIDTKMELANAAVSAEADRERIWQNFYDRRSESLTQLGNTYGQQADYYAQAKEMGVKPRKGSEKAAEDAMKKAFMDASKEAGKSYTNAGLPDWIAGYEGQAKLTGTQNNSNLAAAMTFDPFAKAEGAALRKWAA